MRDSGEFERDTGRAGPPQAQSQLDQQRGEAFIARQRADDGPMQRRPRVLLGEPSLRLRVVLRMGDEQRLVIA